MRTIKHCFQVHNAQNARLCTEDNIRITHRSSCFHSHEIVICQLIIIVKSSLTRNHVSVISLDVSSCYFHIYRVHENWKCKYSTQGLQKLIKHLKLTHTETTEFLLLCISEKHALKQMFKPTILRIFTSSLLVSLLLQCAM